jgi:hypothetical protein
VWGVGCRYQLIVDDDGAQTFQPQVEMTGAFVSDCTSTLTNPSSDIVAMANGFASVSPLGPDLTQETAVERFAFLERL